MTTELAHPSHDQNRRPAAPARGARRLWLIRFLIYCERLWPSMLPALGVIAALAILSLVDAWRLTPAWLHWLALALAAGALGVTFWRDIRTVAYPTRRAAQARLEADGRLAHAPLQSLDDRPADPALAAGPLWRAHQAESAERAKKARLARRAETATARDPYGLRFLTAGLLAMALIAGGEDWRDRMMTAFNPAAVEDGSLIADVWIEPPAHTGKAPIYLMRAGEEKSGLMAQVNAPEGAVVIAQVNGRGRRALSYADQETETRAAFERGDNAGRAEIVLATSGLLDLRLGRETIRWPIGVLPDAAPLVTFIDEPTATDQGLTAFSHISEDDYAIGEARLELRLDPDQERPLDMPALDSRSLAEIRAIPLEGAAGAGGERSVVLDLQADPWAGLGVLARIVVTDGAGQSGQSGEAAFTLPTRQFFNPLARTVLEQRQTLAVAPDNWRRAGRSFDAVTMAPEVFFDRSTDYLLLRTAFWRVMRQDGEDFDDAVEKFWPLALQLEDEALELARQRLEAAEEALREAIERGADNEEIARLTEELRQAMNDYLAALAQSGQRQAQGGEGGVQLDQSSLDEMLDSIRDLAQSGAGNAARQMLSDLQNLLNNLRMSQSGSGSGQGQGQGQGQGASGEGGATDQAGDIIGRQRALSDEAFERGQTGRGGPGGLPGDNADDLAAEEGELGRDLDALIEELQGAGEEVDPDGDAARALGQARNDMREAEQALRNGDFDSATSAMERAIGQIREGAEGLAREEMRRAGEDGQGGQRAGGGDTDPLGRPVGEAYGGGVEVPGQSDAARTRAVIDELRRRLGEPGRSDDEIEYLERLLDRF